MAVQLKYLYMATQKGPAQKFLTLPPPPTMVSFILNYAKYFGSRVVLESSCLKLAQSLARVNETAIQTMLLLNLC